MLQGFHKKGLPAEVISLRSRSGSAFKSRRALARLSSPAWTSTGWYVTNVILDNGFGVVTIDTKWVPTARYPAPAGDSAMELHSATPLVVDPSTQAGSVLVSSTPIETGRVKVAIVTVVLTGGTHVVQGVNSYVTNVNCSGVGYSARVDIP